MFETCYELQDAFAKLFERENKLVVATGEMYGAVERGVGVEVEGTVMEGVEHLGKYVYEMTNARVEALRGSKGEVVSEKQGEVKAVGEVEESEESQEE